MRTFQDLEAVQNDPAAKTAFVQSFIAEHVTSAPVRTAEKADKYDRQLNTGVDDFWMRLQISTTSSTASPREPARRP